MEERLLPHYRHVGSGDVEEERRLCYVGMTRARRRRFSLPVRTRLWGRPMRLAPSRFLRETGIRPGATVTTEPVWM
jgi:ATP-dependent DNA helicase UvrD/PcrA